MTVSLLLSQFLLNYSQLVNRRNQIHFQKLKVKREENREKLKSMKGYFKLNFLFTVVDCYDIVGVPKNDVNRCHHCCFTVWYGNHSNSAVA